MIIYIGCHPLDPPCIEKVGHKSKSLLSLWQSPGTSWRRKQERGRTGLSSFPLIGVLWIKPRAADFIVGQGDWRETRRWPSQANGSQVSLGKEYVSTRGSGWKQDKAWRLDSSS